MAESDKDDKLGLILPFGTAGRADAAAKRLSGGGDPPNLGDMHTRLARLEGGFTVYQWAVGVVSAVLIGAMAIIVALQLYLGARLDTVAEKVDALPDQINRNLLELNRTLSDSITAARSVQQQPTVIVIPDSATSGIRQPQPPAPKQP